MFHIYVLYINICFLNNHGCLLPNDMYNIYIWMDGDREREREREHIWVSLELDHVYMLSHACVSQSSQPEERILTQHKKWRTCEAPWGRVISRPQKM